MRGILALAAVLFASACHRAVPQHAQITGLKADPSFLAAGVTGRLCYGVENSTKIALYPPVEKVLPASHYCIDIAPKQTTTYTLTAWGTDRQPEKKSVEVKVGPPQPRISNLTAKPITVRRGRAVKICFKVENARTVSVKPGKLDRRTNCLTDYPKKTTTYRITASGDDREEDTGTVTVSVVR